MRLFFLGTGAAEGFPALFCECSVCREARRRGGADFRTRSTVLIDGTIKIDLPPDTLAHVHRYPQIRLGQLQHLLFTHSHDDHFAVRELQYLSPNFAPCRKEPLDVYATNEVLKKMMPEMANFFEEAPLRFHSVLPYDTVSVAHLTVTPIVAHHRQDELCLNYLLFDGEKTLLYACDTGWYDPPTWNYLANCKVDAVVIECGKGKVNNGYNGHLSLEQVMDVKEKLCGYGTITEDCPFYLTHISHTGLLLHEEMQRLVAPCGMTVAYDGLEIVI